MKGHRATGRGQIADIVIVSNAASQNSIVRVPRVTIALAETLPISYTSPIQIRDICRTINDHQPLSLQLSSDHRFFWQADGMPESQIVQTSEVISLHRSLLVSGQLPAEYFILLFISCDYIKTPSSLDAPPFLVD